MPPTLPMPSAMVLPTDMHHDHLPPPSWTSPALVNDRIQAAPIGDWDLFQNDPAEQGHVSSTESEDASDGSPTASLSSLVSETSVLSSDA